MPIRPPRRIFRASFRPSRAIKLPRPSGAAVLGGLCVAGVGVAVAGLAPSLFGKPPATAGRIAAGPADVAVVDGETLRVNGVVVRLAGISAPARGEECRPGVDCGSAASRSLAALVHDRAVRCDLAETGGGRPTGACFAGPEDLSRGVVASGWARADDAGLRPSEQQAREAGLGLWAASR